MNQNNVWWFKLTGVTDLYENIWTKDWDFCSPFSCNSFQTSCNKATWNSVFIFIHSQWLEQKYALLLCLILWLINEIACPSDETSHDRALTEQHGCKLQSLLCVLIRVVCVPAGRGRRTRRCILKVTFTCDLPSPLLNTGMYLLSFTRGGGIVLKCRLRGGEKKKTQHI